MRGFLKLSFFVFSLTTSFAAFGQEELPTPEELDARRSKILEDKKKFEESHRRIKELETEAASSQKSKLSEEAAKAKKAELEKLKAERKKAAEGLKSMRKSRRDDLKTYQEYLKETEETESKD